MLASRSGWVLVILAVVSVGLIAPEAASSARLVAGPDFPQAVVAAASLLQLAVAGWILAIVVVSRLSPRVASMLTPAAFRRALYVGALGSLALTTAAQADRESAPHPASVERTLDGLKLPDRPSTSAATTDPVIVRSGDTLWAIAARSLPSGAGDSAVASACSRWHATNRHVIGDDPDLIRPDQVLAPPANTTPTKDTP